MTDVKDRLQKISAEYMECYKKIRGLQELGGILVDDLPMVAGTYDGSVMLKFNALPYLMLANDNDLVDLFCYWLDERADGCFSYLSEVTDRAVAGFCGQFDGELDDIFWGDSQSEYEVYCHIDVESALAWLAENRPEVIKTAVSMLLEEDPPEDGPIFDLLVDFLPKDILKVAGIELAERE